jgi:RHS repeat-associated protein
MTPSLTYTPKHPSPNIGGYRYFFNGQEVDNEVFGENSLFAFEFRMHDARLGRFWSVDPLAAKYPWNSTYAFAENSPIGYLEMEGLEKIQFGKVSINFSNLNKNQVRATLNKYYDYHHGNIKVKEVLQTDNDNEYWKVSDISDIYMRSIGTRIVKFNENKTTTLSDNVRMNVGQFITRYGDLEGHHDGSNSGRLTSEDWTVGLGFVGSIISGSAIIEGGFTLVNTLGLLNSIDDALGVTTKGDGSLSQNLTPDNKKDITNIVKSLVSIISTTQSTLKFTNPKANKVETVVETGVNAASLSSNARKTISQNTKN